MLITADMIVTGETILVVAGAVFIIVMFTKRMFRIDDICDNLKAIRKALEEQKEVK
jgi:hypothetical protein